MPDRSPALLSGDTIRDRLECHRVAVSLMQRMNAAMYDDRASIKARHANAGIETVVSIGPCMALAPAAPVAQLHGRLDAAPDTIVVFGPSLEIPRATG